jgi:ABC-2 type transport system ATP-binding protein
VIQVEQLTKYFGDFVAVNGLSFSVKPGEVLGFLGPNGAGKSTTMKMITGYLAADKGRVLINGQDVAEAGVHVKKTFGYLPEGAPAYQEMTVFEFLRFVAEVRDIPEERLMEAIDRVVHLVDLSSVIAQPIETLSKGYKRRVGLAQALIHDPQILILDEPTDGLDPNQKHQVRELIRNLSRDKIVIISTHILEEVTAVCTRALIIRRGKKVFDGLPSELLEQSEYHNAVSIVFRKPPEVSIETIVQLPPVQRVECPHPEHWIVIPKPGESPLAQVQAWLEAQNMPVAAIYPEPGRLDDVFRRLTTEVSHHE